MSDARLSFSSFDTAIGMAALAWSAKGVRWIEFPREGCGAETAIRLRFPEAEDASPTPRLARAIEAMCALLRGDARRSRDLDRLALDFEDVPPFHRRVYEVAREAVGPGTTTTYGELARRLGSPRAARAVGQALARNPWPIVVPCHRVIASGEGLGGFSAPGGIALKARLLELESRGAVKAPEELESRGAVKARHDLGSQRAVKGPKALGSQRAPRDLKDVDLDRAIADLGRSDAGLRRLIRSVGPCRMEVRPLRSVFTALAEAIVYQQLTAKAAATIWGRLTGLFPKARGGPTPQAVIGADVSTLRSAGLSNAKALALLDLAGKTLDGTLPTPRALLCMDDDEIVERLTVVRGVGRWTAEMLLMFRLGRLDVLPLDDYGLKKGYAATFGTGALPNRKVLAEHGARWAPYRTIASWYLWRAAD